MHIVQSAGLEVIRRVLPNCQMCDSVSHCGSSNNEKKSPAEVISVTGTVHCCNCCWCVVEMLVA